MAKDNKKQVSNNGLKIIFEPIKLKYTYFYRLFSYTGIFYNSYA